MSSISTSLGGSLYGPLDDDPSHSSPSFHTKDPLLPETDITAFRSSESSTSRWQRVPPLYRQAIYATPSTTACLSWGIQLIFFLSSYLRMRDSHGHIPRIGDHYSTFPYISCIGALHDIYFRSTCMLVAACVITSFLLDYYFGKDIVAGRIWRQVKVFWGVVTSIFLVAMSFASINDGGDLHLVFVSIHIWTAVCAKLCDFVSGFLMRKVNRTNPQLIFAKRWKKTVGFLGAPCAIITMIGIYGCDTNPNITTPGSKCYKIVAVAAPAEWILALCFINYLMAMAYVLWHAESIRTDMMRHQAERLTEQNALEEAREKLVPPRFEPVVTKVARKPFQKRREVSLPVAISRLWPKRKDSYSKLG